jgi:hypothetical protein
MAEILRVREGGYALFWCPGCQGPHAVGVGDRPNAWGYNGNPDCPTLTPSVLVTYEGSDAGQDDAPPARCHSFVTDGHIQFLADCSHAMAGQTVPLPPFPEDRI